MHFLLHCVSSFWSRAENFQQNFWFKFEKGGFNYFFPENWKWWRTERRHLNGIKFVDYFFLLFCNFLDIVSSPKGGNFTAWVGYKFSLHPSHCMYLLHTYVRTSLSGPLHLWSISLIWEKITRVWNTASKECQLLHWKNSKLTIWCTTALRVKSICFVLNGYLKK